jgi:hypothetical protein
MEQAFGVILIGLVILALTLGAMSSGRDKR